MNPVIQLIDNILAGIGNFGDKIINLWENEPVAVTAVVTGALDLLIAYNAPITPDQKTAILVVVSGIGALIARRKVTPV